VRCFFVSAVSVCLQFFGIYFAILNEAPVAMTNPHPVSNVAWLCHAVDARHLTELYPVIGHLNEVACEDYFESISRNAEPLQMNSVLVRSQANTMARLYPILLPVTSQWMKRRIESRRRNESLLLVQKGIDLARDLECGVVALGQYTSIVTRNGRSLNASGMGITSGNSYATALAIQTIERAMLERDLDERDQTLVIAGAAGNIGRACAEMLAPRYGKTILLGSEKMNSRQRLEEIASNLPRVEVATDLSAVARGNVVLSSMNCVTKPLNSSHFMTDAIVCDVSVPASLDPETASVRTDLEILTGGIAQLPFGEELGITGFPLPTGYVFGCMAEGILLGFESIRDSTFTGLLSPSGIQHIGKLAVRHGFQLAGRDICRLASLARESTIHGCK
jgi:predicted amino acid dehydrogenase